MVVDPADGKVPMQPWGDAQRKENAQEYIHHNAACLLSGVPVTMDMTGLYQFLQTVVDVVHFTDQTWFDRSGNFHSEALHVVERLTRTGPDHLLYEATIEDPKTFTRPWKMSMPLYRRVEADARLLEYECYAYELIDDGAIP